MLTNQVGADERGHQVSVQAVAVAHAVQSNSEGQLGFGDRHVLVDFGLLAVGAGLGLGHVVHLVGGFQWLQLFLFGGNFEGGRQGSS